MKRLYAVKHPFRGTMVGNQDHSRIFKPDETVWCEAEQISDPVTFEADLVQFEAARIEFVKSVQPAGPRKHLSKDDQAGT